MGFKPEEKAQVKLEFMRMQITTNWYEKGREEGKIEKAQEVICKFLARRFGSQYSGKSAATD